MKIVAVSDIHNSDAGQRLTSDLIALHNPDLVLVCGDVTTFGPPSFARNFLEAIEVITLSVPGNCDPTEMHDIYNMGNSTNLHGLAEEFLGFSFIGWGGCNISSLNTAFENKEGYISSQLEPVMESVSNDKAPVIFLAHCPPFGYQDMVHGLNKNVGSTALAELLERYRPALTICGHVHEDQGITRDKEKNLIVVNVGSAKLHCAAVINLGEPEDVLKAPLDNIEIELIST
jgi:Icc-related predicted phosphoesterase